MQNRNSTSPSLIGDVVGQRFAVREQLDATGHAEVYRAEHVLIHREVALKVARPGRDLTQQAVARFQRVARIATQLEHPNCVKLYDFGVDERGYVYLAMELAAGRDLARILHDDGPLDPAEAVSVAVQILEGLGEAHRRGIVHGELQPRYVMVDLATGTPQVKLLGFGLGRLMRDLEAGLPDRPGPLPEHMMRYAAPELLRRPPSANHRADLFSVGAVLFEALTRQAPWPDVAAADRLERPARRVSAARGDGKITMALDRVVTRALDPDPARRYSDAQEMISALATSHVADGDEVSTVETLHRIFGRYKLLRTLARGGMGELHLALAETIPGIAKVCALKMLRPDLAAEKSYVDRFLDEARLACQLSHANLATVYDVGKVDDRFYMAMEYVVGKDCRRILDRAREDGLPMPLEVALYVARELADALAYAHRVKLPGGRIGLIHRDVSPTNVLVSYEGAVKLIDFGLAKHATSMGKTETGMVLGKLAYMAPEQCLGEPLDPRADIFSIGAVLFELVTGRKLRDLRDLDHLSQCVRQPPDKLPSQLRRDVPPELDAVVLKALAVSPEDRYPHAEGLRDDLSDLLGRLDPRISRDVVARYVKQLFLAEHATETELARGLLTEGPPLRPVSVMPSSSAEAAPSKLPDVTNPRLRVPPPLPDATNPRVRVPPPAPEPVDPEAFGEHEATLVSTATVAMPAVSQATVAMPVVSPDMAATARGLPPVELESEPSVVVQAPPARLASRSLLVLAIGLGLVLGGGGALLGLRLLWPAPAAAPAAAPAPPPAAAERVREERPAPPAPAMPSAEAVETRARAQVRKLMEERTTAALRALVVTRAELPAFPDLDTAQSAVGLALDGGDPARALDAVGRLLALVGDRDTACERMLERKRRYCADQVKVLTRRVPRRGEARQLFLDRTGLRALLTDVQQARRSAGDRPCADASMAYGPLIERLRKALEQPVP
jgi:serine/threonine protein kinase